MSTLSKIRVPGIVWAALLVGVAWFLAANFPQEIWYPLVIVVITALVKAIEVALVPTLPEVPMPPPSEMRSKDFDMAMTNSDVFSQHRFRRWLIG